MFTNYLIINNKLNICIKSNNSNILSQIKKYMENYSFAEHCVSKPSLTFFILKNELLLNKCIKMKEKAKKTKSNKHFLIKVRDNNVILVDNRRVYFLYDTISLSKLEYILKILISLVNIVQPVNNSFYLKATCVSKKGKGILILCDDNKYKEKLLYLLLENGFDFVAKNLVLISNVYIKNMENIITIDLKNIFSILNEKLKQKINNSDTFRKKNNNYLDKKGVLSKSEFNNLFQYKIQDNVVLDKIILLKSENNQTSDTIKLLGDYELFNILYTNTNHGSLNNFNFLECLQEKSNELSRIPKLYTKVKCIQINYNVNKVHDTLNIILANIV